MKNAKSIAVVMVAVVTCPIVAAVAEFGGSVFTYQGQLKEAGQPFNGPADVTFRRLDAEVGGVQIGTDVAPLDLDIVITRGHVDEAEPLLREGVAIRTAIFGEDHVQTRYLASVLANVLDSEHQAEGLAPGAASGASNIP